MKKLLFLILSLGLFSAGCSNRCNHTSQCTRYHEDGRAKPIVALPLMIDTTSFDVCWSISEELTSSIAKMIANEGKIFIESQDDFAIAANPFSGDLSWVKREFPTHEFAVFLELAEHELVPCPENNPGAEIANNLNIGVRIRVIDLRSADPKIVLQERVRDSFYVPKTLFPVDYNVTAWGSEAYRKSPMGTAHRRIASEIAARLSEYILLAKSR